MVNNGKYDEAAVDAEKARIHKRLDEVDSNYERTTMEYLHRTAYQGTPLAHSVLGTGESVA